MRVINLGEESVSCAVEELVHHCSVGLPDYQAGQS
jgi:hypothetical protein